jgi:site-specific DNA recombinase
MSPRKKRTSAPATAMSPAIYLRVSTQEQADSGLGLAAQETRCKGVCAAKGWPDAVIYKDDGISGTLGPDKRPQLGLMLAAIAAGQINAVIVLDLSRLGRNVQLIAGLIEDFEDRDVAFVSCKENFDTSTAMGKAMVNLVAVFGQLERDLTAERTVAALDERGKMYGYKSGRLPLGYERTPGDEVIRINLHTAELVRLVFSHRSTGASMRDVAELLISRTGRPWYASTVKTILDNEPVYRGAVDHWPAIL